MPPKKKSTNVFKKKSKKAEAKDPRVEEVYEETVYFNCPNRGRVAQKVKIKRYKSLVEQMNPKHILDSKDPLDRIESKDDGLSLFGEGDDPGTDGE
jgi:hypothetical protein